MIFTSNASNPNLQLQLGGTGVLSDSLASAPSSLSFGQVAVGSSATLSVVLTNARTWKVTLKGIQAGGAGFSVSGPTLPLTLSPGQSVTLSVAFGPQAAGIAGGSIFVSGPALNIPLTGTGTTLGQLTVTPASLNLGSVIVGSTGTQTASLNASGGSVTISSAASSNSQFALSGATFPLTVGAGQSAPITVTFTPTSKGTTTASLSFTSTPGTSHTIESLAGTGTAPYVSLSWSPSTSPVSGYNVYRGTAPGKYSKINTTLDPSTEYTDSTVVSGVTYYYAATAVDSTGAESTYSAPVLTVIP